MAKIVKQFSKQIIPFSYTVKDLDGFLNAVTADGKRIWDEASFNTNHLFNHIVKKQEAGCTEAIVRVLTLSDKARSAYSLPGANSLMQLEIRGKQSDPVNLKLKGVSLHLFETNVAFLEFDWEYATEDIRDYINANYFLSELKSKENVIKCRTGRDEYREISLQSVITSILDLFDAALCFDRDEKVTFYDLKPVLFSAVVLDKRDDGFEDLLNHSARNFKQSYMTESVKPCTLFTNSHWCGSETALVNISYLTENQGANDFFTTQFIPAARNNYFYLYLLTLNQKFTLLKRISQISRINTREAVENEDELKRQTSTVSSLLGKSQLYETRCNFDCPSSMDHINKFYSYARSAQKVDIFEKELDKKMKALTQLLSSCQKKLADYKDYHHTKMMFAVFLITQLIGSVTMFNSACKIVSDIMGYTVREQLSSIWFPIVLTLAFMIGIGIQVALKYRDLKKLKAKLQQHKIKSFTK